MAKIIRYPFKSAHILNFADFVVGVERVTGFKVGPGNMGNLLLIVELEPVEGCDECLTERRFMVHPANLVFEVDAPTEEDIPDEEPKPTIIVPDSRPTVVRRVQ